MKRHDDDLRAMGWLAGFLIMLAVCHIVLTVLEIVLTVHEWTP